MKKNYIQFKKKIFANWLFPVIFDDSHKGYKEKDAWKEIANSLDFIPDGMYYILETNPTLSPKFEGECPQQKIIL